MKTQMKSLATLIGCFFLMFSVTGCGGNNRDDTVSEETGGETPVDIPVLPDSLYLNSVTLGKTAPNTLKGMMVAVDDANGHAYAVGIMTRSVAVVDMVSGKFIRSFDVSSTPLNVAKLAFDNERRKLWMVSGRGEYIKIVNPDNETVLADKDISGDRAGDADSYPVREIALDVASETLYVARSDGGSRVSVYGPDLAKTGEILSGRSAWAIRWDRTNSGLAALTAPRSGNGEILFLADGDESRAIAMDAPSDDGQLPPNELAIDETGNYYVAGSSLWKIDRSGAELWRIPVSLGVARIEVSNGELGVLHKYGVKGDTDDYLSRLATYDVTDGRLIGTRYAGYECSRMAPVASGSFASGSVASGFIIGFAGNAEIGIYPAGMGSPTIVPVGSAVEDVHFSPTGTRLFMLNRLGGSQLVSYDLQTGNTDVVRSDIAGAWPMRLVMRPADNRLFILSHFESKLNVLRISDLMKTGEIDLGQNHSLTDTVSDLAADTDGNLLACLLCEKGVVVVVDGATQSVLATAVLGPEKEGAGPGRMNAAVDAGNGRIFVYFEDHETLYRLDAANNFQPDVHALLTLTPDPAAKSAYAFKSVYYSPALDKVMVWDRVVSADDLKTERALPGVHRVVAENGGYLYAERHESNGNEILVVMDAATFVTENTMVVGNYTAMGAYLAFDFPNNRFCEALSADSLVHFFHLPDR